MPSESPPSCSFRCQNEPSAMFGTTMDAAFDGDAQHSAKKSPSNYLAGRKPSFGVPASPQKNRTSIYREALELAPKLPHLVNTQPKMFLIQIVPITIASMAVNSTSIESCGCSFCSCFNIYAEFFRMAGFISLIYSCYKFKDMILDQRHNLLDNTQHVELGLLVGKICLGHSSSMTADTMADYVLGRDRYNMCWPRGPVLYPFIFAVPGSLAKYTYESIYPVLNQEAILAATFFYFVALGASFLSYGAFGSRTFLYASKLAMQRKTELGCGIRARCRWPRCRSFPFMRLLRRLFLQRVPWHNKQYMGSALVS